MSLCGGLFLSGVQGICCFEGEMNIINKGMFFGHF